MPASVVLSVSIFAVLLLTLGLAITSVAFIQSNTEGGSRCYFFVSEKDARVTRRTYARYHLSTIYSRSPEILTSLLGNYNVQTCKLSLATATIATTCLAMLTVIELISIVFQLTPKKYKS